MYRVLLTLLGCLFLMHQSVASSAKSPEELFKECISDNYTFGYCLDTYLPANVSNDSETGSEELESILEQWLDEEIRWRWFGDIWRKSSAELILGNGPSFRFDSKEY